jgi:Undecaprenyl-phosphate glucose phosphotransferase
VLKHKARVVTAALVLSDVLATGLAWLAAYFLRFDFEPLGWLIPVTKGVPDLSRYALLLPLIGVLWPFVLLFNGAYRRRRGRGRVDEVFSIVLSVVIASGILLASTLYVRVYYRYQPGVAPLWEYSQAVMAIFVVLDVVAILAGRAGVRAYLRRRRAEGNNVDRVLVAGTGPVARSVAETILAHGELGFTLVGFIDDCEGTDRVMGLPVLGDLRSFMRIAETQRIDYLYIALPSERHTDLLRLIQEVRHECVAVKVVPDLLQYATLAATLDDLDGIPVISLNDVRLQGWASMVKRLIDILGSGILLLVPGLLFFPLIALLIKLKGGKGPVFFRQERMSLDGRTFQMYKFRSMQQDAERSTGPIFATADDPRRTPIGAWLRKRNLDELPQLINVFLGDMSLIGPRPERPAFVAQFRATIPQYMLRHRVKSGMTGWAQVNGWRGNTSIEKRIEFDLYYIENWSLLLDLKIFLLTLMRGFGQRHAY